MRKTHAPFPPQFDESENSSMSKTLSPTRDVKVQLSKHNPGVSVTKYKFI